MSGNFVVSKAAMEYFDAIVSNGAFVVDAHGRGDFNPALNNLVNAMHTVLAGGQVHINVIETGMNSIVKDLDTKRDAAIASLNVKSPTGGPTPFSP